MNRVRKESESFKQYRINLIAEKKAAKIAARGTLIWNSSENGTYDPIKKVKNRCKASFLIRQARKGRASEYFDKIAEAQMVLLQQPKDFQRLMGRGK